MVIFFCTAYFFYRKSSVNSQKYFCSLLFMRLIMAGSTNDTITSFNLENDDQLVYSLDENELTNKGKRSTRLRLEELLEERRLAKEISDSYFYD